MDLKLYLALTGAVGLAYFSYSMLNKPRTMVIPKDLTKRICQQIKHQMMIVCITYSKAMKKIRDDNMQKFKGKIEEVFNQFRSQLSQVYIAKENLILRKYAVNRETYGKSLQKWKHDKIIIKNCQQILNMMQRSIQGQAPDFTVPVQVHEHFNRDSLCDIYKQMVTVIGKKVTLKLQQQTSKSPNFNSNNDDDFRSAIRELSIYDVKVQFLKQKGFKTEWGCPNEIFFKCLQSQKMKSQQYEKKVVAYEKCYQKIIQLVSADPKSLSDRKIDQLFSSALNQPAQAATKPVQQNVQPVKAIAVQPPKVVKSQPKMQTLDEDEALQAMMMQQLLSRSQQQAKEQPAQLQSSHLDQSAKLGLTSSEIQTDWQKNGSIHQKPITKMQEAIEQIVVGVEDENLIKQEQKVVDEAIKQVQAQELAQKVQEQAQEAQQQQISDHVDVEKEKQAERQVVEGREEQKQQQISDSLEQNQEVKSDNVEEIIDEKIVEVEAEVEPVEPVENQPEAVQTFEEFEQPVDEQ